MSLAWLTTISTLVTEIGVLMAVIVPVYKKIHKIAEGEKCQLRSSMLRIYYANRDSGKIRQYEYENFIMLYESYKAMGGNSFIDKIYEEVHKWEIIT